MRTTSKKASTKKTRAATEALPTLTSLTTAEGRALPKPHTGFEQFVEPFVEIVETFAIEIGTGGLDVEAMRSSLALYESLAAPRVAVAKQLSLIDDTRLLESSKVWSQLLLVYARCKVAARTNVAIARVIEDFERFMKNRPHKRAATPAGPPSV